MCRNEISASASRRDWVILKIIHCLSLLIFLGINSCDYWYFHSSRWGESTNTTPFSLRGNMHGIPILDLTALWGGRFYSVPWRAAIRLRHRHAWGFSFCIFGLNPQSLPCFFFFISFFFTSCSTIVNHPKHLYYCKHSCTALQFCFCLTILFYSICVPFS